MSPQKFNYGAIPAIRLKDGYLYSLKSLEESGISYLPCSHKSPIVDYSHLWNSNKQITLDTLSKSSWHKQRLISDMTGIQIFTGKPSRKDGNFLFDIDIEKRMILQHREIVDDIINLYRKNADRPCIILTKRCGFRLSLYTSKYPPKISFTNESNEMLIEFFSHKCLSRIDNRYEQLEGDLRRIPIIDRQIVIDIHDIVVKIAKKKSASADTTKIIDTTNFNGTDLEWRERQYKQNKYLVSQYVSSKSCAITDHNGDRPTVQFSKYENGLIKGYCHNCSGNWIAQKPSQKNKLSDAQQAAIQKYLGDL